MVPLGDGTFCVLASLDDYGDHQSVVTRKAAYRDIVRWVKDTYGVHVKNIDISHAKQRCGQIGRPSLSRRSATSA